MAADPKTEAPKPEKPARKPRAPKMVHEVVQEGATITLRGTDVVLANVTPVAREKHKIKEIEGKLNAPCAEPVIIRFASPAAARKFFDFNFSSEDDQFIIAGGKTDWTGEGLEEIAARFAQSDDRAEEHVIDAEFKPVDEKKA